MPLYSRERSSARKVIFCCVTTTDFAAAFRRRAGSISSRVMANRVAKMACHSKCTSSQLPSSGASAGDSPTSGIMVAKMRFVRWAG